MLTQLEHVRKNVCVRQQAQRHAGLLLLEELQRPLNLPV